MKVTTQCRFVVFQYGMDLTVYLALLDDPERMSSCIGREVRAGAPGNVAGQMIVIPDGEELSLECLSLHTEDIPCS